MLRRWLALMGALIAWSCFNPIASAHPPLRGEFRDDFALSIERFMGADFTDYDPGGDDVTVRLLLNASEPVPTSYARAGFDYFISRFSLGIAGGLTSDDVILLAPRVGYMFGLSRTIGVWLRVGMFISQNPGPADYVGVTAEALFHWWMHPNVSLHFGPTLDLGISQDDDDDPPYVPDFLSIGIPQVGLTVWF
jgi:hypothetical protein